MQPVQETSTLCVSILDSRYASTPTLPTLVGTRVSVCDVYWLRPRAVRDFGTERALVEPLGPIYIDFQSSWLKNAINVVWVCELSEAHTFDFIGTLCCNPRCPYTCRNKL